MNKIEDTPLHRYALVDKTGKTRATCLGNGPKDRKGAAAAFKRQRGGNPIPKGWKVVDRGPVEPPKPEPATPEPQRLDPAAFKVGDSIRLLAPHWLVKDGHVHAGTVGDLVRQTGSKPLRFDLNLQAQGGIPYQFTPEQYTTAEVEHMPAGAPVRCADAEPEPADPNAFNVGDRVERAWAGAHPGVGTVTRFTPQPMTPGRGQVTVKWDGPEMVETMHAAVDLRHVEVAPGPMPINHYGLPITSLHKAQDGTVLGVTYGEVLDSKLEQQLEDARETIRSLTDERDRAYAGVVNLRCQLNEAEREAAAMHERRVKDCVAVWLLEAADNADKVADRDARKAGEFGVPRPSSCDIVAECAQRLRRMARDLFAEVKP